MAMLDTFTVRSEGLCLICLKDGDGKLREISAKRLVEYLELDYKKIFNITTHDATVGGMVDVKISVCKSCEDVANKFNSLSLDMEELNKKMVSCVETMLGTMVNAESDLLLSHGYKQILNGVPNEMNSGAREASDAVKKSVSEKFRKETMLQSIMRVEKTREKPPRMPKPKQVVKENHETGLAQNDYNEENNYSNDPDENVLNIDGDEDTDQLMMNTSLLTQSSSVQADKPTLSTLQRHENESAELNTTYGTSSTESAPKSAFNSKYQCKICNKVVVSLKNFELHQRCHSGEKPFPCPFCEQLFRDTSNLRSHTLRYHRQYLFTKFQDPGLNLEEFKFALDKIVHSIVRVLDSSTSSHQCIICCKQYTQKYAIEDHIVQRHYDVLSAALITLQSNISNYHPKDIAHYLVNVTKTGTGCTRCGYCEKSFETAEEVKSHMKVHVRVTAARKSMKITPVSTSKSTLVPSEAKCNIYSRSSQQMSTPERQRMLHRRTCVVTEDQRNTGFFCKHCGRTLRSYHSQKSHLLSFHRYEVVSQYLKEGTTSLQIERVVKGITERYKKMPSGLYRCPLCTKGITELRKLQTHILVIHFSEVVEELQAKLGKRHKPELQYQWNLFMPEEMNFEAELDESMEG